MDGISDEELIQRYRADPSAPTAALILDQLFTRHHHRVAAWCYRMTRSVDASADLAQEIFLKVYQRLDSFRGDSKFSTWLYTIARNHCMDELRMKASAPDRGAELADESIADLRTEDISDAMERREAEELVRRLIKESLDDVETQVMTLHYVHELPLDAVTRLLRLENQSGAKAYIVSARRKLARALELWRNREQSQSGGRRAR
jgi:RNA polymerase sigma-70 factor (ECF subfamily)